MLYNVEEHRILEGVYSSGAYEQNSPAFREACDVLNIGDTGLRNS